MRFAPSLRSAALCLFSLSQLSQLAADEWQVELLARGNFPGTQADLSGLPGQLETHTPANQLGGFSALDYCGQGDRYWVLSDRGPGDGAATFACRFHEVSLSINLAERRIEPLLLKTTLLRTYEGEILSGALAALGQPAAADGKLALDSEGLRIFDAHSVAISDEYGPSIAQFSMDGTRQKQWPLPSEFALSTEPAAAGARGTYPNRGLEGVTVLPGGRVLLAVMQGPLIQDGAIVQDKCLGLNSRWLLLDTATQKTSQLVYRLSDESSGVSEVLALDDQHVLVLERDSKSGEEARIKRIYIADISSATDVSSQDSLGRDELPAGVQPVAKTLLIDLLDPSFGLGGEHAAEKPEGLSWGPNLPDGRRLLIVCTDNDFEVDRDSEFYAFAIRQGN